MLYVGTHLEPLSLILNNPPFLKTPVILERPTDPFEDHQIPVLKKDLPKVILKRTIEGTTYLIATGGLVAVSAKTDLWTLKKQQSDRQMQEWKTATDNLNLLFLSLASTGCQLFAAFPQELAQVVYQKGKLKVTMSKYVFRGRTAPYSEGWDSHTLTNLYILNKLSLSSFRAALSRMRRFNAWSKQTYLLWFQSLDQYWKGDWTTATLLSWLVVERLLSELWDRQVAKWEATQRQAERLRSTNYTASIRHDLLTQLGRVPDELYDSLSNHRKFRNDFVHGNEKLTLSGEKIEGWMNATARLLQITFGTPTFNWNLKFQAPITPQIAIAKSNYF